MRLSKLLSCALGVAAATVAVSCGKSRGGSVESSGGQGAADTSGVTEGGTLTANGGAGGSGTLTTTSAAAGSGALTTNTGAAGSAVSSTGALGQAGAPPADSGASTSGQGGDASVEPMPGLTLLATLNPFGSSGLRTLRASAGELFWQDGRIVWRVNPTTGEHTRFHTADCDPVGGFDLDADEVFVATCDAVVARSRTSGTQRVVTPQHVLDLARLGDKLYMVGCRTDVKGMLASETNSTGVELLGFDSESCYTSVIAGGSRLYLSEGVATYDVTTGEKMSLGRGYVLDANETNAVIAERTYLGQDVTGLALVDAGGEQTPLFTPDAPGDFGGGVLNDGVFYYTYGISRDDGRYVEVGRISLDGVQQTLVSSRYSLNDPYTWLGSITADDQAIYWEELRSIEVGETTTLSALLWRLDK